MNAHLGLIDTVIQGQTLCLVWLAGTCITFHRVLELPEHFGTVYPSLY